MGLYTGECSGCGAETCWCSLEPFVPQHLRCRRCRASFCSRCERVMFRAGYVKMIWNWSLDVCTLCIEQYTRDRELQVNSEEKPRAITYTGFGQMLVEPTTEQIQLYRRKLCDSLLFWNGVCPDYWYDESLGININRTIQRHKQGIRMTAPNSQIFESMTAVPETKMTSFLSESPQQPTAITTATAAPEKRDSEYEVSVASATGLIILMESRHMDKDLPFAACLLFTLIGSFVAFFIAKWTKRYQDHIVAISVGVMIGYLIGVL